MNSTNIDYVYQAASSMTDRVGSGDRSDGHSSSFDNHLNQASVSIFDLVPLSNPSAASLSSSRSDARSTRTKLESTATPPNAKASGPAAPRSDNSSSASTLNSNDKSSTEGAARTAPRKERANDDHHDSDNSNNSELASAAGTAQTGSDKTSSTAADKKSKTGRQTAEAKEKVAIDAAVESDVAAQSANEKIAVVDTVVTDGGEAAQPKANAEPAKTTADTKAPVDEEIPAKREAKKGKPSDKAAVSAAAKDTSQVRNVADQSDASRGSPQSDKSTALKTEAAADSSDTAKSVAAKAKRPKSDPSGDHDSQRNIKESSHENASNEAVAPSTSATSSAVNAVAANLVDSISHAETAKPSPDSKTETDAAKSKATVGPLGRALRATPDLSSNSRPGATNEAPQVDPTRFVGRVAKAFHTANERGGTLQLRLSPPELGSLKLQLTVKDGALSAKLEADNSIARKLLLDHLPALRDRLAEQNIRVDRFDVDVRQENSGGQANPRGSDQNSYHRQQQQQQTEPRRTARTTPPTNGVAATPVPAVVNRTSSTGINLVV